MNWLKKGPELKLPKLGKSGPGRGGGPAVKAPTFLTDLYQDLRDRRLLLPIALVLVAIGAVPFLMGSDPEVVPPVPAGAAHGGGTAASLTVVEATPGLRDYRKRLEGRTPSDPFEQPSTGSSTGGGGSGGGSDGGGAVGGGAGSASSSEESVTVEESSGSVDIEVDPGGSGAGSGGGSGGGKGAGGGADAGKGAGGGSEAGKGGETRLIEFRFDIQVSRGEPTADGGRRWSEPQLRRRVPALTQLPGKRNAVATVAGVNLRNGKAFILVADDVRSLDGEFACKTRTAGGLCELLEIESGFPLELAYGPDGIRYRIKVIKIDAVWAGRPGAGASSRRVAFGGPAAKVSAAR